MTLQGSTAHGVVGLVLHTDGTLRLFADSNGRMYAEVVGFTSDRGREFLQLLGGHIEDITAEVLVCDDPEAYGLRRSPRRELHYRRAGAGAGTGTGAPTAPLAPAP
jgi:hypothetical protein